MDAQEKDLEEIYDQIKNYAPFKPIPVFEVYLSTFSILITIMLFWFPSLMHQAASREAENLYRELLEIMPQYWWASVFAATALLKALGLMFRFSTMRIVGLIFSSILYSIITFYFILDSPNIGSVQFGCLVVFSILAIFVVKHTAIRN